MRRRGTYLLMLVALAILVTIAQLFEREPRYKGKALSEWLQAAGQKVVPNEEIGESPEAKAATAEAVRGIGTNALLWLLKWVLRKPSQWEIRAFAVAGKLPKPVNRAIMRSPLGAWLTPANRTMQGIEGLRLLGTNAYSAAPVLIRAIKHPKPEDDVAGAVYALGFVGRDGVPLLIEVLSDGSNSNRCYAVSAFGFVSDLGTNSKAAILCLATCTQDQNWALGASAAWVLGELRAEREIAVPALRKASESTNHAVSAAAGEALRQFGEAAESHGSSAH